MSQNEFADWIREEMDEQEQDEEEETSNLLAELNEEQKTHNQLADVRRQTVAPGVMKLDVKKVATTESSGSVTVTVDHPLEGEMNFHLSKPTTWTEDNELVQFLDWYGLTIGDIYNLQTRRVFVDCSPELKREWELMRPPSITDPWRERAKQRLVGWFDVVPRDEKFMIGWLFISFMFASWFPMIGVENNHPVSTGHITLVALFVGVVGVLAVIVGMCLDEAMGDE